MGKKKMFMRILNKLIGWDVSKLVFLQDFSVSAQETTLTGMHISTDGTKMYVIGFANDKVYEYDLSTAWDVSTSVFLQDFSVSAQDTRPYAVRFKPDGTKMYFAGRDTDKFYEYDLSTAWDISTASFLQSFSFSAEDSTMTAIYFRADGLKFYAMGLINNNVNEYDLSTAWDISTASFFQSFDVSSITGSPLGLYFKPDGTKMYFTGGFEVNEYDLSTAWDISTASFFQDFTPLEEAQCFGLFFRDDGIKMYFSGNGGDKVYEYDL